MISLCLMKAPLITITMVFFNQGNHAHAHIYTHIHIHFPTNTQSYALTHTLTRPHTHTHTHTGRTCLITSNTAMTNEQNHKNKPLPNHFTRHITTYDEELVPNQLALTMF